jgi:hypothetical protein
MTAETRKARPKTFAPRVLLSCDARGCTLSGLDADRRFRDLETALACARRDAKDATVEVWQGGQYICCVAPRLPRSLPEAMPLFPTAERYANLAAKVILTSAGPFFWAALIVATIAGTLGWRFL